MLSGLLSGSLRSTNHYCNTQATTTTSHNHNVTGVWSPPTVRTTLGQLRALEKNVVKAGGKGPGSSSTFRLQMLEEVLSLVIPPLAAAEAEAEAETKADGGGGGVVGV